MIAEIKNSFRIEDLKDKKITFFGWAFKKDTNDTRKSAAIYIADKLIDEHANVEVYDPKVSALQMQSDLNYLNTRTEVENNTYLTSQQDPYEAASGAHALAIITEWDEFVSYDWNKIFDNMSKPAHIFDGRNLLDKDKMESIGFNYVGIGQ